MHSLLTRQLKKTHLTDLISGDAGEHWLALLDRVSQSYTEADQERYLLERSLNISSREMQDLSGSLRAERDRLTAILNSLGDGLCALDSEGRLLFINPQGEQLLGWRESELVGTDLLARVGASATTGMSDLEWASSLTQLVGAGQAYRNEDGWFLCKNGTRLPVAYVVTPLTTLGNLSGAVLVFRDMTMRKQQLAAQTQLVRRDSLLRLARRFAAESDPEQLLTDLLVEAEAVLDAADGTLARWDAAKGVLVTVRNSVPNALHNVIEIGVGVSGRAAEGRVPVFINDYQKQVGHQTPAGRAGVLAALAVPLMHEGRLIGAVAVNTYDPNRRFTEEDAEILEILAGLASAVLVNLERTAELADANLELRRARDEAQHRSLHDGLTGLPNRILLRDRLEQAILVAERNQDGIALLIMDLDRFKDVNDTLGHQAGDELLQQIAVRLRTVLRASDTVARMGGDEFAIVLPTAGDAASASEVAQAVVRTLEAPFKLTAQTVAVGASIGISVYPEHGADTKTLLRHADVAMYIAKRADTGYAVYSREQDAHGPERLTMISELREAIDGGQLTLHYQPKVNVRTGLCDRVEALVRWQHPVRGLILPDHFIPLAEQTGLIKPLTNWVLHAALHQTRAWQDDGLSIAVSVNLSMRNLHDPDLVDHVAHLLDTIGIEPMMLKVEVTESSLMVDPQRALGCLARLGHIGVEAAIDDFGTGQASLSYLKHMPVHEIKLDRSFVRDMRTDKNDYTIVRSTIELAHDLGLQVIAEGVEDQTTWDLLAALGCDLAQGYHMSRPLAASDLQAWLANRPPVRVLSQAA